MTGRSATKETTAMRVRLTIEADIDDAEMPGLRDLVDGRIRDRRSLSLNVMLPLKYGNRTRLARVFVAEGPLVSVVPVNDEPKVVV